MRLDAVVLPAILALVELVATFGDCSAAGGASRRGKQSTRKKNSATAAPVTARGETTVATAGTTSTQSQARGRQRSQRGQRQNSVRRQAAAAKSDSKAADGVESAAGAKPAKSIRNRKSRRRRPNPKRRRKAKSALAEAQDGDETDPHLMGTEEHRNLLYANFIANQILPSFLAYPSDKSWTNQMADYISFRDPFVAEEDEGRVKVYFTRHRHSGLEAVVKAVDLADKWRIKQMLNETEILSQMTQQGAKNVVRFYYLFRDTVLEKDGTERDCLCLVTEYLNGGDLKTAAEKKVYDEKIVRPLVQDILNGIHEFHKRQLMHLDLALINILLHRGPNDQRTVAKVIDAGIARRFPANDGLLDGCTGTENYFPPEAFWDHRQNRQADFFALGVGLYKLLTGKLPSETQIEVFDEKLVGNELDERLEEEVQRFVDLVDLEPARLTPSCKEFLRWLLSVEWQDRPASVEKVRQHRWLRRDVFQREYKALRSR